MSYPIKPICEAKDKRNDGTSVIYLQYCYASGKRTNLNTGLSIPPRFWNKKQEVVSDNLPGEHGSAGLINDEITRQLRLAEDLIKWATQHTKTPLGDFIKKTYRPDLSIHKLNAGITLTQFNLPDLTRSKLVCDQPAYPSAIIPVKQIIFPGNQKDIENPMIFPGIPADSPFNKRPWPNVFDQLDAYMKDKKGHVSDKTIQVYKNVGDHLKQFEEYRKQPITFLSFDFDFYDKYKHFLTHEYVQPRRVKEIKGMKRNSISKTIKQLRIFVKDRIKRKIIPPIDMTDFKAPEEETDATYMNFKEISQFYHADLSPYPDLISDQKLFVLACLTGLRFSDFSQISAEDYRDDMLYKKTDKSDSWVIIPLRDEAKAILEDFIQDGFPVTSSVKFNENIKIIGKLAGLTKRITFSYKKGDQTVKETKAQCDWISSHTGRRSFCTNEFLDGTPVKLIMRISGHKKEKDFYRYIRISPEEGAMMIKKLWNERGRMKALQASVKKAS